MKTVYAQDAISSISVLISVTRNIISLQDLYGVLFVSFAVFSV